MLNIEMQKKFLPKKQEFCFLKTKKFPQAQGLRECTPNLAIVLDTTKSYPLQGYFFNKN